MEERTTITEKPKVGRPPKEKKPKDEEYFLVKFHAKSDPTHKDDVELAVNGETLILQREKKVVLPERFLECADHARYVKFKQEPGKNRKVVAHIRMFPYDRLGKAESKDFFGMKEEGTKITKEKMDK